jgi:DNA-binding NtrC family response regulator
MPLSDDHQHEKTRAQHPATKRDGRPRRILVVDDEENVALTLQRGLRKLPDCQVVIATGARQALQLFAQGPFDLVITDYKMPDMDGLTLAANIKESYPQTIVILITGHGTQAVSEQATHVAIRCVLDKPVMLTEIRDVASQVLAE